MMKERSKSVWIMSGVLITALLLIPLASACVEKTFPKGGGKSIALENWSEDTQLTMANSSIYQYRADINVQHSIVHAVYEEHYTGGTGSPSDDWYAIRYIQSMDYGKNWDEIKDFYNVNTNWSGDEPVYFDPHFPEIVSRENHVYTVWQQKVIIDSVISAYEIYFKNSSDNGQTWSNDTALTSNDGKASQWPKIAVWNNTIHVVWSDWRNPNPDGFSQIDVYYRKGVVETNSSILWDEEKRLTNNTVCDESPDGICVINNTVHIILTEYVGYWRVGYMKSEDNGATWSDLKVLNDGAHSYATDIVGNNSTLHVVFYETKLFAGNESAARLFYIQSNDSGNTWQPKVQLTYNLQPINVYYPSIVMNPSNENHLYITYNLLDDSNYGGSGKWLGCYYMESLDGGTSWQVPIKLTGNDTWNLHFGLANGYIHGVYINDTSGNSEIYYKRSPMFNDPPLINYFYPLENLTITENQNITFIVNVSDPDNDTLSYQWYLNNEMVIGENSSTYTFTANSTCSGIFEIKVVVSDNISLPVNHGWTLTVINVGELYNTISDLQDQINQLNLTVSELNGTINNLTQSLTLIWNELNQSIQDYSDLQNQTMSLLNSLSTVWNLLNLSKENETELQAYIDQLTENLTQSNNLIAELQNLLNLSKQNETILLNQIHILEDENEKLRNELNETKKTPWVGAIETVILLVGLCIIVLAYSRKKRRKKT